MTAAAAATLPPDGSARPARRSEIDAVRGQTTAPIFLSRWITHFCAPTFFLLAA